MEDDFKQTNHINDQLTLIAGVEIAVILAAGLYQFFTLKNYLSTRQYI
jgi:predicted metal-binding membrane protein